MSKHVEIIARLAGVGCESAFNLEWHPKSCVNALHGIDMAYGIRENQIEISSLRASHLPLTQCVHNDWRKGGCRAFWLSTLAGRFASIGWLADGHEFGPHQDRHHS